MEQLQNPESRLPSFKPDLNCRCHQPGHFARDCDMRGEQPSPVQPSEKYFPPNCRAINRLGRGHAPQIKLGLILCHDLCLLVSAPCTYGWGFGTLAGGHGGSMVPL